MLQTYLRQQREIILKKWFDLTVSVYEPEMIRFMHRVKNPFTNPVRHSISTGLAKIIDGILNDMQIDICSEGLAEIIKIRAVQSFNPSKALAFLFALKDIVREELTQSDITIAGELQVFDKNVDKLLGIAFDMYNRCREKIYDIRIAETMSRSRHAFELLEKRKKNKK